jgi:hypothetical protein
MNTFISIDRYSKKKILITSSDNWRIKNQQDATYYFIVLRIGWTCLGLYYAHHQESAGCSLQPGHYSSLTAPNLQHTANQERNDQCCNQQRSCELLMMGIIMSETCWVYKNYNKIISGIYLVFSSSVITMIHSPINIRFTRSVFYFSSLPFKWWLHAQFRNSRRDIHAFFTSCNGINVLGIIACIFTGTGQEMSVWFSQVELCRVKIKGIRLHFGVSCNIKSHYISKQLFINFIVVGKSDLPLK